MIVLFMDLFLYQHHFKLISFHVKHFVCPHRAIYEVAYHNKIYIGSVMSFN